MVKLAVLDPVLPHQNDADAELHRALHEHTARAREIMERALERLLVHEKIVL